MNIIFAKHEDNGKEFCFEVLDEQAKYIERGNWLLVKTYKGKAIVTAATGVISGSGAKDIADRSGAYFPLKKVISFVDSNLKEYIYNAVKESVAKELDSGNEITKEAVLNSIGLVFDDDLPF